MRLSSAIQEALLALLCYDDKSGAVAASLVPVKYYDPVYKEVAEQAVAYRERFKATPGEHTLDIFDTVISADPDREDLFGRLYESVSKTAESLNGKYVIDQARAFVRYQSLKRAMATAIRHLDSADEVGLGQAETVLAEALKQQVNLFDPGVRFIHDIEASVRFFETQDDIFPTGIPALDEKGLGPAPGRVHLYIAPAKTGKSNWLVNLATRAHQHAKKVCYITLELSEDEVCQRMVQSMFSMTKREAKELKFAKFVQGGTIEEWGNHIEWKTVHAPPSLDKPDSEGKVRHKLKVMESSQRMVIKEFPPGVLTCKDLDAYLDLLEQHESFVADLLIVDYPDEMKLEGNSRWEALLNIMTHLKRIARERNIAVAVVSQTKISGDKALKTDVGHVGGAWDKIGKADTVITYSQTEEEKKDGIARLHVAASRTEEARFEVLVSQNYALGQFVLSSIRMGSNYQVVGGDSGSMD